MKVKIIISQVFVRPPDTDQDFISESMPGFKLGCRSPGGFARSCPLHKVTVPSLQLSRGRQSSQKKIFGYRKIRRLEGLARMEGFGDASSTRGRTRTRRSGFFSGRTSSRSGRRQRRRQTVFQKTNPEFEDGKKPLGEKALPMMDNKRGRRRNRE